MKVGDFVVRISYGKDVLFQIQEIHGGVAHLKGVQFRLWADAPIDDLEAASQPVVEEEVRGVSLLKQTRLKSIASRTSDAPYFDVPGMVLHLDGDRTYLKKSMDVYNELEIPAEGFHLQES